MKLGDILNPWAALAEARVIAEQWRLRATSAWASGANARRLNRVLQQEIDRLRRERDEALATCFEAEPMLEELLAIKRERSEAISRGNRTRARRRRGGLLPAPINEDTAGALAPILRTELTG